MYFDFDPQRPETPALVSPISAREGVLLSIIVHLVIVIALIVGPQLPWVKAARERADQAAAKAREAALLQARQQQRFVFVAPRNDVKAPKAPERADLSDQDRMARTPERAPAPTNTLPFARGNTPERVEAQREARARGEGPLPAPGQPAPHTATEQPSGTPQALPEGLMASREPMLPPRGQAAAGGGSLGESLKNLQRYVQQDSFDNRGGSGPWGPAIQFDTKGVEFGPWIRRFIAQIKRNWFVPMAAMSLRGNTVLTFNVHKDGTISDLSVARPSSVDAFTHAAYNAMVSSNPTQPLPPEYPSDKAFFTVTFYYNETPPQ